ncbi:O-antigen ligase family protein [Isobaculum melis]|uniref:O-Antigen ligase n=1 Tax=Isobaculum melis TaxID=142588 RepID=A0A1H9QPD8_9LACT|nr:O-antigen ligase family protein [Isobaculum melis]SER62366.1 O-Antigen ligase [Isobaculum melis]
MEKNLRKIDLIICLMIPALVLFSQETVNFLATSFATSGTATLQIIEIVIVGIAFYPVFIQLLFRRKIMNASLLSKIFFTCMMIFGLLFVGMTAYRIVTGNMNTGSFYLARVVIETALIMLTLDYFKVNPLSIIIGFILALLTTTVGQYFIILFGKGFIRGRGPILSNSVVYVTFTLMIIPLLWYFILNSNIKIKIALIGLYLLTIPPLLLAGSRSGFVLALLISFLSILLFIQKRNVKAFFSYFGILFFSSLVPFIILLCLGSSLQLNEVERSVSIPISTMNKVLPSQAKVSFKEMISFRQFSETSKQYVKKDKKTDYTIEVSNNQRKDWNQIAKNEIFENLQTFLLGTGKNQIVTKQQKEQSPHNVVLQYLLPFGLIGTIFAFGILFSPLVLVLKKGKTAIALMFMVHGAVLINGIVQPIYGWLVICLAISSLSYAIYYLNQNENKGRYPHYQSIIGNMSKV